MQHLEKLDPIRNIQCVASADDPLQVTVVIELAEHVAACCLTPEASYVEFSGQNYHARREFVLREHRPGHLMEANLRLPTSGTYRYRIVAKILGRSVIREGIYDQMSFPPF